MGRAGDLYRQFKEWQLQPYQVAPLSEEQRECATCGTHYQGNYCPRCGQSAMIGRYSFKNAFMLFLDVWGLGNRGMFRGIRDLLFRPGYMIRDYLRGMHMAYFPPFKMYFLLFALSLLIDTGLNIKGINRTEQQEKDFELIVQTAKPDNNEDEAQKKDSSKMTKVELDKERRIEQANVQFESIFNIVSKWMEDHYSGVLLVSLLLFCYPLWLLFRHCPAIPDLRLSECFVAMVYISNMLIIYSLIPSLLCFSTDAEIIYGLLALLMVIFPIKQLSGYGYWSTIWRLAIAALYLVVALILLITIMVMIYLICYLKQD
jgi:hypothetical protein